MQRITLGAAVSAFLHAILLAVFVFGLPELPMDAEEPEAIQVQLVLPEELGQEDILQIEEAEAEPAPETEEAEPEPAPEIEETASADPPPVQELETLRPVFQFGEEDAGPAESLTGEEGDGSQEAEAEPSEELADEPEETELTADATDTQTVASIETPVTGDEPESPAETLAATRSLQDDGSTEATTAKGDLSRSRRAGELCSSELQRQLLASEQPYWPVLIPRIPIDEGTVLDVQDGAFATRAGWYNITYRCEIDEEATRVVFFDHEIGSPIPPEEWASRGLPAF